MQAAGRPPLGPGVLEVARTAGGLVAVAKPPGVLSHPNGGEPSSRALLTCRYDEAAECYVAGAGGEGCWWLLHRLDAATSGVVALAEDARLAEAAREAFAGREVRKVYRAVVFGTPLEGKATWRDRLETERRGGVVRTRAGGGGPGRAGVEAAAEMRVVRRGHSPWGAVAELELVPRTGRTHQLRVQCARRRLPIVGDATYGDFARNRALAKATGVKRLLLHAARLELSVTWAGGVERLVAEADPGEWWEV